MANLNVFRYTKWNFSQLNVAFSSKSQLDHFFLGELFIVGNYTSWFKSPHKGSPSGTIHPSGSPQYMSTCFNVVSIRIIGASQNSQWIENEFLSQSFEESLSFRQWSFWLNWTLHNVSRFSICRCFSWWMHLLLWTRFSASVHFSLLIIINIYISSFLLIVKSLVAQLEWFQLNWVNMDNQTSKAFLPIRN